ncbi:sulfite oxidase-like oxidoreductase [Candidatus Parcubacteria bacterium]|nr:sulfite oxidase-like oxidoreductase [Candidatus Parcubacteria bacterium]
MIINDDFIPKRKTSSKLPPGQYEERGFPVLSLGPTPDIDINTWKLEVTGLVDNPISWTWQEFNKLSKELIIKDIHCVTKWSKFDSKWEGVPMQEIFNIVKVQPGPTHLIAHSYDGYTTNLPIEDISNGKAWVATAYDSDEIEAEHGGPARLLVPHLYFWKSAKWLNKLEFVDRDQPGFWETRGYHNYGDPWQEQRYWND